MREPCRGNSNEKANRQETTVRREKVVWEEYHLQAQGGNCQCDLRDRHSQDGDIIRSQLPCHLSEACPDCPPSQLLSLSLSLCTVLMDSTAPHTL